MNVIINNIKRIQIVRHFYNFSIFFLRIITFYLLQILYGKNPKLFKKKIVFNIIQNSYRLGFYRFIISFIEKNILNISIYINKCNSSKNDKINKSINDLKSIFKRSNDSKINNYVSLSKSNFHDLITTIINLEKFASVLNLIDNNDLSDRLYIYSLKTKSIIKKNFRLSNNLYFFPDNFRSIGHSALISTFIKAKLLKILEINKLIIIGNKNQYSNFTFLFAFNDFCSFKDNISLTSFEEIVCNSATLSGFLINNRFYNFDHFHKIVEEIWCKKNRPLVTLDKSIKKSAYSYFINIHNFNIKSKFVLIHVRQNMYQEDNLRDAKIDTYKKSISFLNNNNISVIRIGDNKMPKLDYKHSLFLDLTFSNYHTHLHFLFENCLFSICTGSGPAAIHFLFNKPRLLTNWAPLLSVLSTNKTFILTKHFYKHKIIIPLDERITNKLGYLENKMFFDEHTSYKDNSDDEILFSVMYLLKLSNIKFKFFFKEKIKIKKLILKNSYNLKIINYSDRYEE